MCNITIQCADCAGGGGSTGYEVVHETVPVGAPQDPYQQVDAPAGKFVVDFFIVGLQAPAINKIGSVGAGVAGELVVDAGGRITGVLFEHKGEPYEAYVVCVNG